MKQAAAIKLIEKELTDLGVSQNCSAYQLVMEQAKAAAEVMTRIELKKYIEEYVESLPNATFQT